MASSKGEKKGRDKKKGEKERQNEENGGNEKKEKVAKNISRLLLQWESQENSEKRKAPI